MTVMKRGNAASERSFSALCRVKSYLRPIMSQERLNHLMLLYVHKDLTDSLNLTDIASEFVAQNDHCMQMFGQFS